MESRNVGYLFGRLLQTKYPQLEEITSISLDDLLSWPHWPNFIRIYSKEVSVHIHVYIANVIPYNYIGNTYDEYL